MWLLCVEQCEDNSAKPNKQQKPKSLTNQEARLPYLKFLTQQNSVTAGDLRNSESLNGKARRVIFKTPAAANTAQKSNAGDI